MKEKLILVRFALKESFLMNEDVLRLVLQSLYPSLDDPPQPDFLRKEVYPTLVKCFLVSKAFDVSHPSKIEGRS